MVAYIPSTRHSINGPHKSPIYKLISGLSVCIDHSQSCNNVLFLPGNKTCQHFFIMADTSRRYSNKLIYNFILHNHLQ